MKKLIILLAVILLTACGGGDNRNVVSENPNPKSLCMFDSLNDHELQKVVKVVGEINDHFMELPTYKYFDGTLVEIDDQQIILSYMIAAKLGQDIGFESVRALVRSEQYPAFISTALQRVPYLESAYEVKLRNCYF